MFRPAEKALLALTARHWLFMLFYIVHTFLLLFWCLQRLFLYWSCYMYVQWECTMKPESNSMYVHIYMANKADSDVLYP